MRRKMGTPVEFAVLTEDGGILFAGPLPPKYGNLPYPRIEGGRVIMSELEFELWEDAWSDYKKDALIKAAREASTKRDRKQAMEAGVVVDLSPRLALPSRKWYEDILSTKPNPMGYLLPVKPEFAAALRDENEIDEAILEKIRDETAELDRPLLYVLYTVLQQKTMEMITKPKIIDELLEDRNYLDGDVTVFMPAFSRVSGHKQNRSKDVDDGIFAKLKSFENVYGIVEEQRDGKTRYRCEPVLRLQPRKISDNSFTFSSRYMKEAILRILKDSLQYEKWDKKKENPKTKHGGEPFFSPHHCFLIKSSIAAERNKSAVAIACEFAVVVAKTGDKGEPNLKGLEIINRCPELKKAFDAAGSANIKNTYLKRAFSRAWQLLAEQTTIAEDYVNVKFPTDIPTTGTLKNPIYIRHNGRKKKTAGETE